MSRPATLPRPSLEPAGTPSSGRLTLPRKAWVLISVVGVFVAVLFALVPVGVNFGDDPLLRLRQLDPQLSPPETTADCGSPVRNLSVEPQGTSLYDVARASGCERAARRRLLVATAAGSVIVMVGLLGLTSAVEAPRHTRPGGLLSAEKTSVGERTEHGQSG